MRENTLLQNCFVKTMEKECAVLCVGMNRGK